MKDIKILKDEELMWFNKMAEDLLDFGVCVCVCVCALTP